MKTNQKWLLKSRPVGLFKESDFEWREEPVATLKDGEVLRAASAPVFGSDQ